MVNERLIYYLEKNNLLTKFQAGFRAERGTVDQLVRLDSFIREAFKREEHVVGVFFDLAKAYDTTWKYGGGECGDVHVVFPVSTAGLYDSLN